jgi:GNAT superfamily N-acetyltransferase
MTLAAAFRQAAPSDEPVLWDMLYLAVFIPPGGDPLPRAALSQPELARYVRGWGRPGDLGQIAISVSGDPIGAAWLRVWREGDVGYGYIDPFTPELCMAVRPEWHGRGVGTRLLQDLLRRADRTHERVSLSVSLLNPARRLYERFGFTPVASDAAAMTMVRNRVQGTLAR